MVVGQFSLVKVKPNIEAGGEIFYNMWSRCNRSAEKVLIEEKLKETHEMLNASIVEDLVNATDDSWSGSASSFYSKNPGALRKELKQVEREWKLNGLPGSLIGKVVSMVRRLFHV